MNTRASAPLAALGERGLIERIRRRLPAAPPSLLIGIGDDAAVAAPDRGALAVLTTDALVEGVHFDWRFSAPRDVGWKALAVNISDVAAMGGASRFALLSLAIPEALGLDSLDELIDGFLELAAAERVAVAGGNITRSPGPLMIDVCLMGAVKPRRVLTRGGARAGDAIYVSGAVGAGSAGLRWLQRHGGGDPADAGERACVSRYRRPEPRARLGALLGRNRAATACMDLSDGLADGVRQIAGASGVGAALDAGHLPIPPAAAGIFAQAGDDAVLEALAGGDDYELVFAASRRARGRLAAVARQARGVALTRIGEFTREPELRLRRDGTEQPLPAGFVHF